MKITKKLLREMIEEEFDNFSNEFNQEEYEHLAYRLYYRKASFIDRWRNLPSNYVIY